MIAFSDAYEEEANGLLELLVILPEIRDVIAQLYPLVPQPQIYVAGAVSGSQLGHSNALSPVTACPRIKV